MKKAMLLLAFGALLTRTAPAQNYQNNFDSATCGSISGWSWDSTRPNTAINVDLYDGSTFLTTVVANNYRADMFAAGMGNGNHGFSYTTPSSLKNGQNHSIHAKVGGTARELSNSPLPVNCPSASMGYQYSYSDALANTNNWTLNQSQGGSSTSSNGFTSSGDGTLLAKTSITPSTTPSYEVRMQLRLTQSGGYYMAMLRASSNALLSGYLAGTYYGVEVANPTFDSSGACSATLYAWKVVAGSATVLSATTIPCYNGMTVRAVMFGGNTYFAAYIDNVQYLNAYDTTITSGSPGVAVAYSPAGNSISLVQLGALDTTPPNTIPSVSSSAFPTHVDFQWPGATDDPNGTGVAFYQLYCNGGWLGVVSPKSQNEFTDSSVSPGTSYTYLIQAVDFHWNIATTTVNVTTPAAAAIDPRRAGVRPTGSYWGAAGENIDMRSSNLNFTIPLLKVKGRGWNVPFNLSYNSQNWRSDSGGIWNLNRDSGFGQGWKLQGGALAPVYSVAWTLHHYVFIDATGAEYRLDQNNGGIWTSKESLYVEYDSNAGRLYFPDGTFWVFGSTSGGSEQDSGLEYPTLIQDSNGNQITINYQRGQGMGAANTSSRILGINDVMGSYTFSYTTGWFRHLTTIASTYPAENYSLSYTSNANLLDPFAGGYLGINAQMLQR